ncbi:hypothetical protein GQ44DRAFT_711978 [Phaeosphaeriaceae sp. PMI808]|nr:hypothetical protein GQ44DRAFT_711978 [Phaeosphaeriaceae sp. PMI808]
MLPHATRTCGWLIFAQARSSLFRIGSALQCTTLCRIYKHYDRSNAVIGTYSDRSLRISRAISTVLSSAGVWPRVTSQ